MVTSMVKWSMEQGDPGSSDQSWPLLKYDRFYLPEMKCLFDIDYEYLRSYYDKRRRLLLYRSPSVSRESLADPESLAVFTKLVALDPKRWEWWYYDKVSNQDGSLLKN